MRDVRCVWPLAAEVGEGPVWCPSDRALWFVDIRGRRVHRFDPSTEEKRSWPAPDQVSFVMPSKTGLVVGLPGKLAHFSPTTGEFETCLTFESDLPNNRTNDACVDAAGRLWFGTMDDLEVAASGVLYCWEGGGAPVARDRDFVISNGPAHSPDGRIFYHTDTVRRTIFQFEVAADGTLSKKQPFIEIEADCGWPDGLAVDAEGCLWVALWGGQAVRRYSPGGDLLEIVELPCVYVSKLAFGGDDLKTAFVTTARSRVSAQDLGRQPLAGGVFAFEVDVPGIPCPSFAVH